MACMLLIYKGSGKFATLFMISAPAAARWVYKKVDKVRSRGLILMVLNSERRFGLT